jgi:hypothetical protein
LGFLEKITNLVLYQIVGNTSQIQGEGHLSLIFRNRHGFPDVESGCNAWVRTPGNWGDSGQCYSHWTPGQSPGVNSCWLCLGLRINENNMAAPRWSLWKHIQGCQWFFPGGSWEESERW